VRKVGDLLREFLKQKGWLSGDPYGALFREWEKIAGEGLSGHSRLVDVRNGVLLVEVDHPGWFQMMQLRKKALLEAARRAAPQADIEDVRIRLGRGDTGGSH